jgi:hypothetical protein
MRILETLLAEKLKAMSYPSDFMFKYFANIGKAWQVANMKWIFSFRKRVTLAQLYLSEVTNSPPRCSRF